MPACADVPLPLGQPAPDAPPVDAEPATTRSPDVPGDDYDDGFGRFWRKEWT